MSYRLLSFTIACCVALGVFLINQALQNPIGGRAMAAVNAFENVMTQSSDPVLGVRGGDVLAVLAEPEMIRADLPTVVWQYRNGRCVLDLYFTASSGNVENSPVVHYETRIRDTRADDDAPETCLSEFISERPGSGSLMAYLGL